MKKIGFIILIFLLACQTSNKKGKEEINVYCAASLTGVVSELSKMYQRENNIKINLNFASSGTLARQIEQGAPANIYLSANKTWIDYLYTIDLTEDSTIRQCAVNSLVIIAPSKSSLYSISVKDLSKLPELFKGRLSIGNPEYVPAGSYAKQALQKLGCYDELEGRLLPAKDVRSALMMVELAESELGIVYLTDALSSQKVKVIGSFPDTLHQPIGYYISMMKNHSSQNASNFYTFIQSYEAREVWKKYGFQQ